MSLLLVACQPAPTATPTDALAAPSISAPSEAASARATQAGSPTPVAGGCGETQVFLGPGPDAALGLEGNAWAAATPWSVGLIAYFWSAPPNLLQVPGPDHVTKVLWIYHGAAQVGTVTVDAHPLGASTPHVTSTIGYAVVNGGNYPSSIEVPTPGCWELDVTLGATHATLDVEVAAAP
jgi:hypothetical protein